MPDSISPSELRRRAAPNGFAPARAPGDELFDRVGEILAGVFHVSTAVIHFVDGGQDFKSSLGSDPGHATRSLELCNRAMLDTVPLVVPDLLLDERYRANADVAADEAIRFFAGVPIVAGDGSPVGVLCLSDRLPRELTAPQIETLRHVASLVTLILELRRETLHAVELQNELSAVIDASFSATSVRDSSDDPNGAAYAVDDNTAATRQRAIERRRYHILELSALGAPLQQILDRLIELAELSVPDTIGTILRVEDGRISYAASSSAMPEAFGHLFEGAPIGPNEGSCGSAAFLNETVIVSDIEHDPRWAKYRDAVLPLGLRSCWSTPIVGATNRVIGTLAFYARTVREPSPADLDHLLEAGHVASLAMTAHAARLQLERMVYNDPLTGLHNRIGFERDLENALDRARAGGTSLAVGLLGLDRFKTINDSLGHAVGDLLLKDIAFRLRGAARPEIAFARLNSDEFAFYVSGYRERDDAESTAGTLAAALETSFVPDGEELFVRATTGFSVFPGDATESSQLIALAHRAMRRAKSTNDRIGFHSGLQTRDGRERLTIETNLRRAMDNGEFELVYQPIVLFETGETTGAEALLRWNNPVLGTVPPDVFIPVAEETGTIVALGAWVLAEACRFARTWLAAGGPGQVSVNVSARQFEGGRFARLVIDTLEATGLPPENLCLEITESLILRSPETALDSIRDLRKLGVRCALDDFGTGYSSMTRLMRFPIDALKIDRSFLTNIGKTADATADMQVVLAIINLGRSMHLSVVAEGVETSEQRDFLMANNCDSAQGYLFARPMSGDDLLARSR